MVTQDNSGAILDSGGKGFAKRKKKRGGLIAVLAILLIVLGAGGWFAASLLGILGPKNLGVTYTEADYLSAMEKIGTDITFEGKTGDELRELAQQLKKEGQKYSIHEYEWTHSDFARKTFELTSAEATALINEIAPAFWWFEQQQVKVHPNGVVEGSGTGLFRKAVSDLYPELVPQIPVPLFEKVNLYARGTISITDNQLELNADRFLTGPIEGVSAQMLNEHAYYFEAIYTVVPGLIIHSLTVNDRGNFEVDALIPQKTEVVRKGE